MRDVKYDIRVYLQPAFLICAAVLAIAAAGMSIAVKRSGVYLKKEPLPLKKSLDLLDEEQLAPYNVIEKRKILNEEIVEELGTEDYIQWVLEDPNVAADSPVRKCLLFITYYRLPDRVPHVPEECYTGGGYQRLTTDNVTFEIKKSGLKKKILGKYLVFGSTKSNFWQSGGTFPVLYLFKVDGEYAGSRDEARITLNKNLFRKHSYFCKIELVFNQSFVAPDKERAVAASEKLLNVILPILEREHWPDW
jgi:hypothetical protein